MVNELTGRWTGPSETDAVDEVIKTGLEDTEEGETGDGLFFLRKHEHLAELPFVEAIEITEFLLLEKLGSVFGWLPLAVLAMLTRPIGALFEFLAGFEEGEIKMTGFAPRASGVPRHMFVSFLRVAKLGCFPFFPGCRPFRPK